MSASYDASQAGSPTDQAMKYQQFRNSGDAQKWAEGLNFDKPGNWNQMSPEEQKAWTQQAAQHALKSMDGMQKSATGNASALNLGPQSPDLTDELLAKTRTNFALRLQTSGGYRSAFAGTQTGGLALSKNILGGY